MTEPTTFRTATKDDYNVVVHHLDGVQLYLADPLPMKDRGITLGGKRLLPSRWHSETRLKHIHVYYEQGHKGYA